MLFASESLAQQVLMFRKNFRSHVFYQQGEVLSFQLHGDDYQITDRIIDITDSTIVFRNYSLKPSSISHLYLDKKNGDLFRLRSYLYRFFIYAGALFTFADVVNTGELSGETAIIGGSLVGAGVLIRTLPGKKIRLNHKRRLFIIRQ